MGVTIKQIAAACGVSRGTVDRVVNHRGNVKPETERLVRLTAQSLGYRPNLAAKVLAERRNLCVGVLLCAQGNPFFDEVIRGVKGAANEIADYGVSLDLQTMKGYDPARQCALMEELKQRCNVLVLNPCDHPSVADKVRELKECGIQTVTVNTDIPSSGRLCYVGSNAQKGGQTACGMLAMITGGNAQVGIVGGSEQVYGHRKRIEGFCETAVQHYPGLEITAVCHHEDDDDSAKEQTERMLREHPEISALFLVAAGVGGVCQAVIEAGREELTLVCFDGTPVAAEMIRRGLIKAAVCQHPYTQGYKSVQTAFRYLITGEKPARDCLHLKTEILIRENLT